MYRCWKALASESGDCKLVAYLIWGVGRGDIRRYRCLKAMACETCDCIPDAGLRGESVRRVTAHWYQALRLCVAHLGEAEGGVRYGSVDTSPTLMS